MANDLSISEALTTFTDCQTEQSQSRNQEKETEGLGERTFVVLLDNVCKFHSVTDPVYGNSQTMANDMFNVSLLVLPVPKKCSSTFRKLNLHFVQVPKRCFAFATLGVELITILFDHFLLKVQR